MRDNTCHNQKAYTVADSIFVNLLAEPHQKNCAGGHTDSTHNDSRTFKTRIGEGTHHFHKHHRLHNTYRHGEIASVFLNFFVAGLAFGLELFEGGHNFAEQHQYNRCRDIWHNAETEKTASFEVTAAKHLKMFQSPADRTALVAILRSANHLLLVNARQRNVETNPVNNQQRYSEQHLVPQIRNLKDIYSSIKHLSSLSNYATTFATPPQLKILS